MRMMVRVRIPAAAGNKAIKDGSLPKIMQSFADKHKPEAMYFTTFDGDRTMYAVFDMAATSQMVAVAEPFFMGLDAQVAYAPVMNPQDLQTGLGSL